MKLQSFDAVEIVLFVFVALAQAVIRNSFRQMMHMVVGDICGEPVENVG